MAAKETPTAKPDAYAGAVQALYRAPHADFVAERKRLAAQLKAAGDRAGAAQIGKLGRPSMSAWVVNQLWWQARSEFEALFDTAAQLRAGKLVASAAHRQAVAKLTARAQQILSGSGHGTADAMVRRVTMTLSGLAASGGFDPEPAGALTKDRDPPGFEAFANTTFDVREDPQVDAKAGHEKSTAHADSAHDRPSTPTRGQADESETAESKRRHARNEAAQKKAAREQALAEKHRAAEQRAEEQRARRELEAAVGAAKAKLAEQERERERLGRALAALDADVEHTRAALESATARLSALTRPSVGRG